jgi:hypothetical protein
VRPSLSGARRGLLRLLPPGALNELQQRAARVFADERLPAPASPPPERPRETVVIQRQTPLAPLVVGWHPDPYRRWKARYWDGHCWTERVGNPGNERPEFGRDVIVPYGDGSATVASVVLLESFINGELVWLRSEVDKWRTVAEERGHALARLEGATTSQRSARRADARATSWYGQVYGE